MSNRERKRDREREGEQRDEGRRLLYKRMKK